MDNTTGGSKARFHSPKVAVILGCYSRMVLAIIIASVALVSAAHGGATPDPVAQVIIVVGAGLPTTVFSWLFGEDFAWTWRRGKELAEEAGWDVPKVRNAYRVTGALSAGALLIVTALAVPDALRMFGLLPSS